MYYQTVNRMKRNEKPEREDGKKLVIFIPLY